MKTYFIMLSKNYLKGHPKQGEATNFKDKFLKKQKIHTFRNNYNYWKNIIDQVNDGKALLSIREWSGIPYQSKHIEIKKLYKGEVGIQQFEFDVNGVLSIDNNYTQIELTQITYNDGFTKDLDGIIDFLDWMQIKQGIVKTGTIIHFTNFLYTK